uniref:Putative secreted protein n=1 Tax=Anopheles darlingi TaxID=43151 RepID=A0A2M4D402_ANODA
MKKILSNAASLCVRVVLLVACNGFHQNEYHQSRTVYDNSGWAERVCLATQQCPVYTHAIFISLLAR